MNVIKKQVFVFMILVLTGCRQDIPEPESKMMISAMEVKEEAMDIPVTGTTKTSPFIVSHRVNGKNVLVECKLEDISFRSDNRDKQSGKIVIYIDGKKTEVVQSPVFIIKGLTKGSHNITLEVVNNDNQPYPLKKDFSIVIP